MFEPFHHSLAMPFLVPPSKPRRSGFAETRIVDNHAAVRRELRRIEKAENRSAKSAANPVATPASER